MPGAGKGGKGCGNKWPPWWNRLIMDQKDKATQTDRADQGHRDQATQVGALSADSSFNHTFNEAIDFIISATASGSEA